MAAGARASAMNGGASARRWRLAALLSPAVLTIAVFFLAPFAILLAFSIGLTAQTGAKGTGLTFAHFARMLGEPLYQRIMLTTVWIALVVTGLLSGGSGAVLWPIGQGRMTRSTSELTFVSGPAGSVGGSLRLSFAGP